MNGPSPTRTVWPASARSGKPHIPAARAITVSVNNMPTARFMASSLLAFVSDDGPGSHPAVDPLLHLRDDDTDDRQHDEAGEYLLRFHDLSGIDQQVPHPAPARAADHLGRHHQDDGDTHPQMESGEDTRDGRRDHNLHLDLATVRAQVFRRLHQATVRLAYPRVGADDDGKEGRHGAD